MSAGLVILLVIVVPALIVGAITAALLLRKGSSRRPVSHESVPTTRPEVAPMTGLEDALSQVTDRSGRPIRDAIDAEAAHVDELRVVDDTGPVLRRALDSVAPDASDSTGDPAVDPSRDA